MTDKPPIRVLLVDEHLMVRTGLRMLLESWSGFEVVGEAATGDDAVALSAGRHPDILLVDLESEGAGGGLELLPRLLEATPSARILVLTANRDTDAHQRAARAGALGVVMKNGAIAELRKAIEKVHAGEVWLDRHLTATLLSELQRQPQVAERDPDAERLGSLTEREREVAALVCHGLRNKQIGERLFISETTVRHHLTSVFAKLAIATRFELVMLLYRQKLVEPPF